MSEIFIIYMRKQFRDYKLVFIVIKFSIKYYSRLKEHVQMNNDPRIRQLLIDNLVKSGSNEEMLQQVVRNYP